VSGVGGNFRAGGGDDEVAGKSSLLRLIYTAVGLLALALSTGQACAGTVSSAELRQQIIAAEMTPWNGGTVSLDETLRGPNHEKVSLRQFVGRPILAYNYAQW
jgi:hypothetical protein